MKKILFVCLLYITIPATGQVNPDSLGSVWNDHNLPDSIRLNAIHKIAWDGYLFTKPDSAYYFAQLQYDFAKKRRLKKQMAEALNTQGVSLYFRGNYAGAIDYYTRSLTIREEIGDKKGIANSLGNIGNIYKNQGDYAQAIDYYTRSLTIMEEVGDKKGIASCLNNIGVIYHNHGDYAQAIEYYTRSLTISEEIGNKMGIANTLNNIGIIYMDQADYAQAIDYYTRSLTIREEIGDKKGIAASLGNIGNIYSDQGDYVRAIDYFTRGLTIEEEIGDKKGIATSLINIGVTYRYQGDYAKAIEYGTNALTIGQDVGAVIESRDAANVLFESYKAAGKYKSAMEIHDLYISLRDSILSEENRNEVIRQEYKYKYEKEKQLIELEQQKKDAVLAEEAKQQKYIRNLLITGFVLMGLLVLLVLRSFLQKRKANHLLAEQKEEIEEKNTELLHKNEEIQTLAEKRKATNEKLKEINVTKDKFFSIIAHDLKNPFNSLLGFSDILLKNHKKYDEEEREEYIKIIRDSSISTHKLLENLLTWARSQSGQITFSPEKINIKTLINEIILSLKETAGDKNIRLLDKTDNSQFVNADINMTNTIIRNLISNAIKFTPKGGEITVKAHTITDANRNNFTEIAIKDNGVGIPPEKQTKLFKITENVSTTGTEKEKGTGLGLILCKEFVEKHEGKIWVESEVGKGSKFVFTLKQ